MSVVDRAAAAAGVPTGFYTLVKREILRYVRRPKNTFIPPFITNVLYFSVFGVVLGSRVGEIIGVPYILFILPGLVVLGAVSNAFENASFSIFHGRWNEYIDETLTSPLSYTQMVWAYLLSSALRGVLVGTLIGVLGFFIIGGLYQPVPVEQPIYLVAFLLVITMLFSSLGIVGGLLAEDFDDLTMMNQFLLRPLVFFGAVFYSLEDLTPGCSRPTTTPFTRPTATPEANPRTPTRSAPAERTSRISTCAFPTERRRPRRTTTWSVFSTRSSERSPHTCCFPSERGRLNTCSNSTPRVPEKPRSRWTRSTARSSSARVGSSSRSKTPLNGLTATPTGWLRRSRGSDRRISVAKAISAASSPETIRISSGEPTAPPPRSESVEFRTRIPRRSLMPVSKSPDIPRKCVGFLPAEGLYLSLLRGFYTIPEYHGSTPGRSGVSRRTGTPTRGLVRTDPFGSVSSAGHSASSESTYRRTWSSIRRLNPFCRASLSSSRET